jgi:8-oxo-dGTP pyrophosphatase MutT (NUDIX family)
MIIIIKAGGIVYKMINKEIYLLLIGVKDSDEQINFQFPKGKLEEKEELSDCAIREVYEETGKNCIIEEFLDQVEVIGKKKKQKIYYYIMKPMSESVFRPEKNIVSIKWVPLKSVETNRFLSEDLLNLVKKYFDENKSI